MIHGTQCTWLGELRIPFAFHVHQPSSATLPDASFHQFTRLPTELQLQVFRSCDKPTLFQLMHTSRPIRTEATKLFFSDPEAWYIVDGLWFAEGAHPTDGVHDMDFLHYIQRLHIQFEMFVFPEGPLIDDDLRNVWDRIQFVFPRVSCIMISDALSSVPPPESHKRFCGLCPPAIDVFLSLLVRSSRHGRRKRIIWRRVAMEEDQTGLQEVDGCQIYSEPSIMVPDKPLHGLVGMAQLAKLRRSFFSARKRALKVLRIAAIERHHFFGRTKPFKCPAPHCYVWIEQAEGYTDHIWQSHRRQPGDSYVVPEPYRSLFNDANARIKEMEKNSEAEFGRFMDWWGERGSEKREAAKEELSRELVNDALRVQEQAHNPLCFRKKLLDEIEDWTAVGRDAE